MTMRTYATTEEEAKDIIDGDKRFIFRTQKQFVKKGDVIGFRVVKSGKPVRNSIDARRYIVTSVSDAHHAPIDPGIILIGFREANYGTIYW